MDRRTAQETLTARPMSTSSVLDDLRHAARGVRGMPTAAVIVGSLAVGIGVNTIVFSWMQAPALWPLPGVSFASDVHLIEPVTETGGRLVRRGRSSRICAACWRP